MRTVPSGRGSSVWLTYMCTVPFGGGLPSCGSHTCVRYRQVERFVRLVRIRAYGTIRWWPAFLWFTYMRTVPAGGEILPFGSHTCVRYHSMVACLLVVHIHAYGTGRCRGLAVSWFTYVSMVLIFMSSYPLKSSRCRGC